MTARPPSFVLALIVIATLMSTFASLTAPARADDPRAVLAVEDTSTTLGSVLTAVDALAAAGATTVAVAVIVDRGAGPAIIERGLEYRAAYSLADLDLA